ncbi:alpha/beta hydrolase [Mycobacterium sp.]|jgi:pimeloyl-ACP methyl ester carboxylesterase|uniref:alpha/beta fold hydrolase n=1 Tax=Mycobacterium sp. TaxID=1785 RepID=UPI002D5FE02F|nr:alpha/beta hydrolase [Mycobacterium sp.]HZA11717.1 alpha/beta hydrolase [Mycobacterium sp.]
MAVREPGWAEVEAPTVTLRALRWQPAQDGKIAPIALCLHGFPDTPHGWRFVAPKLVAAGWRVVAPFMRGYAPSTIPSDGSYHIGAVMDDALRVLNAAGPTGRDVVIGHDWGAMAAWGLATDADGPFTKAVAMSLPPGPTFRPCRGNGVRRSLPALLPGLLLRMWHVEYFQIPWLPDRSASWLVPRLWRQWSPGFDATEDLRHVDAAIGSPESWRAAIGFYRANVRAARPPKPYVSLQQSWQAEARIPVLYMHGADDRCMTSKITDRVGRVLPRGGAVRVIEHAGHFLQLEQPDTVVGHILDFIGPA